MRFMWIAGVVTLFCACNAEAEVPPPPNDLTMDEIEVIMEDANTRLWQEEDHLINMYVQNQQLDVVRSGTGLRYQIYQQSDGPQIQEGLYVLVDFTITLLHGDTCYTSIGGQPEEFLVGRDAVESGLHEGVMQMKVGEKAILIIPYRMAHGLIGDEQMIPPLSTIVYNIEVLDARLP